MKSNARIKYADIIDLPHHQSSTRQHMSLYDRAAQFAPFAALTGYDDMIVEEGRLTDQQLALPEHEIDALNQKIQMLEEQLSIGHHPQITVTYFVPDELKAGGRYDTISAYLKKIDPVDKKIILYGSDNIDDKRVRPIEILIDRILSLQEEPSE